MKINELHDELFRFLIMIDDICKKNNLTYFLDGGAELGSVREKDLIPWDDDIDLKIFAEDWPKFREVLQRELPSHIKISEPQDFAPAFYDLTYRIYDERILIRKETEEDRFYQNRQNHLGVDIFFLCKIPENKLKAKWFDFRNRMLYGYAMQHRFTQKTENYSFMEKMQVRVLTLLGKRYTAKQVCEKWYRFATKYNGLTGSYQRYPANWPLDDLRFIPQEIYDGTAEGEIRGRRFPIPAAYDRELTIMYGDWRTPRETTKENGKEFIRHLDEE